MRQRRTDLRLTQHTLAPKIGCVYPTVAAWESGASEPRAARWRAIEGVLGVGLVPERDGFPGRVQAARPQLRLAQERLAAGAGLDSRTVRNMETGRHRPSRRTMELLTEVLSMP